MDIFILIAAVLLISIFCFKNVPPLFAGLICSLALILIYQMDISDGLLNIYMGGLTDFAKQWLILFTLGGLFGKLLEATGGADSLARTILKVSGNKNISMGVMVFTAILAAAGISSFITMFIVFPIAIKICRKANINRGVVVAGYFLGLNVGLSMPYMPVTNNILCASYFGTEVSAGGVLALFVNVVYLVLGVLYIKWYERRLAAKGLGYAPAEGCTEEEADSSLDMNGSGPHWLTSFIPMLVPVIVLNLFKIRVEAALLCGVASIVVLQFKYLPRKWEVNRKVLTDSIDMSLTSIINAGAIVGFGAVVQNCPGYMIAVEKILSFQGSPLMISFIGTSLLAGIAGSSSAGLVLAAPVLQQAAALTNAAAFHRTTVFASLSLDSLPNSGFLQTVRTVAGVKFKDVYLSVIFVITVVLTLFATLLYIGLCMLFGVV